MSGRLLMWMVIAIVAAAFAGTTRNRMNDLDARVRKLECTHGESSVRGHLEHGRFVYDQRPHATGCRP